MNFIEQFPVLNTCTYLNTAYSGILSKSLCHWRQQHDQEFLARGSAFRAEQAEQLPYVKQNLARFFGAKTAHTFLVPNFSFAFNTLLGGLSAEHRFLLLQEDYPSVNYPVQCRGFTCNYAAIDEHLEENILGKIREFQPTVLAISLVQYISGIKISLEFLKKLKSEFPELLIIADGTQFCGTERFNFEASGIDVLISSGYKWMLGGFGNGFVFLKDGASKLLYTEEQEKPRPAEPFLSERSFLSFFFEPGHQDTLSFGSLNQSLLSLEQLGYDYIEPKIKQLIQQAKTAFTERGLLTGAVVQRKEHSSIFNLNIQGSLIEKLGQANIQSSARGKGIRVSFHFYNTEQELNRLLDVIDRVK